MKKNDLERRGALNQTPQHIMVLGTDGQALKSDAKLLVLCWFVFLEKIARLRYSQRDDALLGKHIKRESKATKSKSCYIYFS